MSLLKLSRHCLHWTHLVVIAVKVQRRELSCGHLEEYHTLRHIRVAQRCQGQRVEVNQLEVMKLLEKSKRYVMGVVFLISHLLD